MSLTDDFLRGLQKKNATTYSGGSNKLTKDFVNGVQKKKKKDEDDIAPVIITDDGIAPTFDSPAAEVGAFLGQSIGQSLQKKADEESFFDGWFKKGNKDVSKAILGTLSDLGEDLTTGIVGLGEKIVDAGAWLAPAVSKSQYYQNGGGYNLEQDKLFEEQNKTAKEEMSEFIAKDLYDEGKVAKQILSNLYASQEMTNIAQNGGMFTQEDLDRFNKNRGSAYNYMVTDMEKDSVLDEKSDSLVQSAGQLGATAALSAVGVPWYLITGASTFGSEAENALNQGATFEEAGLSATISAGAEILTEKISGGIKFGGKTLDEGLTKLLSRNISNRAVRTAAKLGIDMAGEGGEEILSGLMSAIGQKLTYAKEKELEELFSKEDAWESFIGGAVLGGVGSATQAAKGSITGVDSVTELTKNEQKVVDKLYEDALAEEEKKGKVTQKQKAEIYDDILNKLEKGYIDTDIIEEVLGGDSYNTYKETLDNENALTEQEKKLNDEFKTLNKMVWQEMTGEQHDRREELRGQLEELRAKIADPQSKANKDMLKAQLTKDVYEMSKGDRLVESFFEQVRSKQKYEADLTKYEGRARDVIQKVMESGLADNTNQTHEFWDWAAKMASDLDTDITLAENEQLLEMVKEEYKANGEVFDESQFEGQTIDGYASKNGIVLNAASKRALNFIVGHEVTHKLEKSKHYDKLQKLLLEYAKDEYESRFQKRSGQYSNKFKADEKYKSKVDMEVTGDLVGDYLFTDKGFIDHLTKDRNVFQRVWDEVKYMAKIATAGSEQAKQLEKVKREFERAYREANKKAQSGVQFSVSDSTGRQLTKEQQKYFQNSKVVDADGNLRVVYHGTYGDFTIFDIDKTSNANDFGQGHYFTSHKSDAQNNYASGDGADVRTKIESLAWEYFEEMGYTEADYESNDHVDAWNEAYDNAEEFYKSGKVMPVYLNMTNPLYAHGSALYNSAGEEVTARSAELLKELGYDGIIDYGVADKFGRFQDLDEETAHYIVFDSNQIKNVDNKNPTEDPDIRYSVSDSDGKELTKEQQDYFKDSKMRDENGNLKVMYHGSQDAGFHVFDAKMSDDDTSFFFVDRNDVAASYSGTTETYEAKTIRSAEDMNNFLAEIGYDHYQAVERNGKFELLENNEHVATKDTPQEIYEEFCWYEGVGDGDANYKVYLNLTNPLEVDVEGRNWDNVSREYSQEINDAYQSLTDAEKEHLTQLASWEDVSVFRDEILDAVENGSTEEYALSYVSAYNKLGGKDADLGNLFAVASEGFTDESIQENAVKRLNTRDYAQKAKAEGYDGVIFKNIVDVGGYGGDYTPSTVAIAFDSNQIKSTANAQPTGDADIRYSVSEAENQKGLNREQEVVYSISYDSTYMDNAIKRNEANKGKYTYYVDSKRMEEAKVLREKVAARMNDIKDRGLVGLPEDMEGNTYIANSSYDGTEENTTICPRSLAAEAFVDAVSEYLGRPLTVKEQIYISQDLQGRSLTPECTYCYVATDRKAYRAFLGEYINQRDSVLQKLSDNPNADVSRSGELYKEFLNGRKDTNPMYNRFKMWVDAYQNGTPMVDASHLANINRLMGDIKSEFGEALKPQIVDAMKYAQSASWAKKRINYVAYNGHILNWKQDRINKLNSHYGLRMYSFSDFHPAFVLENMQMITDASVRGLKMLGYTKDTDFVEIFAPSGMNINVSTFGFESGGNVYENNLIGAEWEKAKALRSQYPNVGVTFVATNDTLVNWALEQDWIDVVIPYHLVRTGAEVAEAFKYTNYTSESADTKTKDWVKGDKKSIAPTEHNNDLATYLAALEKNHLKPRFERFIDNPNYMKLVNECRQPASMSKPVQPVFNEEAAMKALAKLEANGYYQPIGGSVDRMYEIAAEVAEDMTNQLAPAMSVSDIGEQHKQYGRYNVYAKDMLLDKGIAPVAENATSETISKTESVPVVGAENETTTEELFPDDLAPMEDSADRLASLDDADAPPETDTYYGEEEAPVAPRDPFEDRDFKTVGKRGVHAYMFDHPEVKPYFQMQAKAMLGDLQNSVKGEKWYNDELYHETNGESGWGGTERQTTDDIAYLLDMGYTYAQIEYGLKAIIEDNGAENIAIAKKIEFALNDRLRNGYTDINGVEIPANQDYLDLLAQNEAAEAVESQIPAHTDADAPVSEMETATDDIAPVAEEYEAIRPKRERSTEPKMVRADSKGKERKWVGTSTGSDAVDGKVLPEDLDQELIHYQPISNKKTLGNANTRLNSMGYEASVAYMNSQFANNKVTLDDIALGERLIQEAVKRGDTKTAGDLIMDISILGTELGQKVQALSIIKRLTPEGQLRMLQRTVERGKTKGDKAFEGVEITQEMIDYILKTYGKDGTYDQAELDKRVEDVKQKIADQMKVTAMDKVNAWRYLSMLGNPKTHIRNLVSNIAMKGTVAVKNAVARTIETVAPIKNRTKTWKAASEDVQKFAAQTTMEMKDIISGDTKYSESASIKEKRQIFKNKILNGVYEFNSDMLGKEDWWFSKPAFTNALSEYLTANGITTEADIKNNPKTVEKAKQYALEQSQIATFRQYSWLANEINRIERKNAATGIAVGSVLPFKKTPINIAKTGLSYSPLGFAKTLTYDVAQVKKGNMEASELVDHLAQNVTGSALTLVGYMLASAGFLNGAGDDDKEGEYDYQLGEQAYSVNIGGATYSLSWLSPVAMPLFVGANAYEQLVEGKEWNGDVVVETLAQTLDPLSEMSFISSLDSVLSSYDSGLQKFAGIFETAAQNYVTQFAPTLMSQIATVTDDTKRSTKVAADSDFKFVDETINKLLYKIPGLRQTLEPSTDIWGNEVKQTENWLTRSFETFLAPYAKREDIAVEVDEEIKALYRETGDNGLIPDVPYNYINYDGEKYEMSAKEFTDFKKAYGQAAFDLMEELFDTKTYQNADSETRADMVNRVYDYARDEARKAYFAKQGIDFTNATAEGREYYKENPIKGAIEADLPVDEYVFSEEYPAKYSFFKKNGISYEDYASGDEDTKRAYTWAYENPEGYTLSKAVTGDVVQFRQYISELWDIKADKDKNGKSISGSRKRKVVNYLNNLDADYYTKIILFKNEYNSDNTYNYEIVEYLNSRQDISYKQMEAILKYLGFDVDAQGNISW